MKTIHKSYHYGNERHEVDMTEGEFIAYFDDILTRQGVQMYAGVYPHGSDVSVRRNNPYGGSQVFDYLEMTGRLEFGWSTFTMNEES